jgi:hypothetical protein
MERSAMKTGRPAKELVVSSEDRVQLESIARSQSLPAGLVRRAQMILHMADGESNSAVARRPRFHVHFTPTYRSWLNQVERWFALITNQPVRRGSFESVSELKRQINAYVDHHNQHPKPFMWTATADSILARLERLCKVLNGTQH